jgi:zinc transport system ATP-binding protein
MSVNILTVENLHFCYNSSEVLSDISFSVSRGDYIGLVGPNGSGKTTLIKIILGLLKPYRGTLTLFGNDSRIFSQWDRIGYLPQMVSSMNPRFPATVREVVAMGLISGKGFPKYLNRSDRVAIDRALELLDIKELKKTPIGELSGGQQQRVLVARAIVNCPEFIILDEPTAALDPEMRDRFFALLRNINRERQVTIIMVTHDIGNIGQHASKLLYIDKKIIFYGSFSDFCLSSEITQFFGEYAQHVICHRHNSASDHDPQRNHGTY